MKNTIRIILVIILSLLILITIKTIAFKSLQVTVKARPLPDFRTESIDNLSKAVSIPTITYNIDLPIDTASFLVYHQFLIDCYPLIHSKLTKEIFSEFSLLYSWKGTDNSQKPIILMAHYDVVPAGEISKWTKPPFSGKNDDDFIWGRGTLDDKTSMISIMEAVEQLLNEGYQPERTIYLAFGHDEEISGKKGATVIANNLKERGISAEFVLDEGFAVTKGIVPLIEKPVALIGTSEKGYLSVNITVEMHGGHSSYPEKETAITTLTKALNNITEHQMDAQIIKPLNDFIKYAGPEMPFYAKAIFANQWLFKRVIINIYEGSNTGNALVRTTTAPTIIKGGIKENVIPTKAEAVVNFRILPGETSDDVLNHLYEVIDDERVIITKLEGVCEPSSVSSTESIGFKSISKSIRQTYPEAIIAPSMMIAASDSRKYLSVCQNIYNFAPIILTSEDMKRIHGIDERIKIKDYNRSIGFYYLLIKNSCN